MTRLFTRGRGMLFLALPLLLLLLVFFVYPVGALIWESFYVDGAFTLDAYVNFLGTPAYVTILFRTFAVAFGVTLICLLLAYPYAYLMVRTGPKLRALLFVLVLLPFFTSLMVRTYSWLVLLQDQGPIVAFLEAIGFQGVTLLRSSAGVIIGTAQILLPFMALPIYNNLIKIEWTNVLAAKSLGSRPIRAFWRVYFPQSTSGVFAGSILVFIVSLGFYITPVILGSPRSSLMSQLIVREVSERLDWVSGAAMAAVLVVITLALVALSTKFVKLNVMLGGEEK